MKRWQILSAVALRKLPEIIPRRDPIELKVQEVYNAFEVSQSRLSDHELQHIADTKLKENQESEVIIKETAQDREDKWIKEASLFKVAEYNERLSKTQYLFMKQKFCSDIKDQWLLPQALYDPKQDENLLDTARRALRESLNIINGYKVVSKIPSSVYSFRYPKKVVELTGYDGAKVFFLKAQLDTPSASVLDAVDGAKNDKLLWLTREEAFNSSIHKRYMISFSQGLLHEDRVDTDKVLRRASGYAIAMKSLQQQQQQKQYQQ